MDKETFEAYIAYYGEENIVAITFDNSSGKSFVTDVEGQGFTMENYYNSELGCLQLVEFDRHGNPFHVLKPTENIQAIIVRDGSVPLGEYDIPNTLF